MSNITVAKASARLLRTSPRKLNLVASTIRGMNVAEAVVQLTFSKKRIAQDVKKCLNSAIANAENNFGMDIDNLIVSSAHVGKALVMKRMITKGRGRAGKILKFFSNLYIEVKEIEESK